MSFQQRLKDADVRVLTIDIENAPNIVHTWGLFNQNIGINQVVEPAKTFGVGFKWYHERTATFVSDFREGHEEMLRQTHAALSEADIVIGYNHVGFDLPHLNREFAKAELTPVKPSKNVDLLRVVRKQFKMTSNKLDFVAEYFGLGNKTTHTGHQLWKDCMAGDAKAWALMEKYCKQDVVLTEKVYNKLLPWIPNHPHLGMWIGNEWVCSNCGADIDPETPSGTAHTFNQQYNSFQCTDCGHWLRSSRSKGVKLKTRSAK